MGFFINAAPRQAYLAADTAALGARQDAAIGGSVDLIRQLTGGGRGKKKGKGGILQGQDPFGGFKGIVDERRDVLANLLGELENYGGAQRERIGSQYDSATGRELGRLETRGFGASNLGAAAVGGLEDKRQQSLLDLEDSLLKNRVDFQNQGYEGIFGTQERGIEFNQQQQEARQRLFGQILGSLAGLQSSRPFG